MRVTFLRDLWRCVKGSSLGLLIDLCVCVTVAAPRPNGWRSEALLVPDAPACHMIETSTRLYSERLS
jgi:hypothetical protein